MIRTLRGVESGIRAEIHCSSTAIPRILEIRESTQVPTLCAFKGQPRRSADLFTPADTDIWYSLCSGALEVHERVEVPVHDRALSEGSKTSIFVFVLPTQYLLQTKWPALWITLDVWEGVRRSLYGEICCLSVRDLEVSEVDKIVGVARSWFQTFCDMIVNRNADIIDIQLIDNKWVRLLSIADSNRWQLISHFFSIIIGICITVLLVYSYKFYWQND